MNYLYIPTLLIIFIIWGCSENNDQKTNLIEPSESITLNVIGLHCDACVKSATDALAKLDGVGEVVVSLEQSTATITPQLNSYPDIEQITEALERIGYEVVEL